MAAVAWSTLYGVGAYLLGDVMHEIAGRVGVVIGVGAVLVIGWAIFFLRRNEKRLEDKAEREMAKQQA